MGRVAKLTNAWGNQVNPAGDMNEDAHVIFPTQTALAKPPMDCGLYTQDPQPIKQHTIVHTHNDTNLHGTNTLTDNTFKTLCNSTCCYARCAASVRLISTCTCWGLTTNQRHSNHVNNEHYLTLVHTAMQ